MHISGSTFSCESVESQEGLKPILNPFPGLLLSTGKVESQEGLKRHLIEVHRADRHLLSVESQEGLKLLVCSGFTAELKNNGLNLKKG